MNYISIRPKDETHIQEGDICIIHISEQSRYVFKIEREAQLQTKFGHLKADDLIGHPYGQQFDCKRGWVLPLRLTPEFWTKLLPHRTQILYQADISMILLYMDIKPGSIVVESGTGSGSLSHSILRACLPNGFLHTFEFNETRANEARREFEEHGFGNNVRVYNRDVCQDGFNEELNNSIDACMLDLPRTWDAIEHAHRVLKSDGSKLCTFSPCIEQVKQNVIRMSELKFKDIVTYECIMRPMKIEEQKLRLWNEDILDQLVRADEERLENIRKKTRKVDNDSELKNNNSNSISSNSNSNNTIQQPFSANQLAKSSHLSAKPCGTVSHSGFLTFASKRP